MITTPTFCEQPDITVPAFMREGGWEDHSWHNDAGAFAMLPLAGGEILPCGNAKDRMLTCGDGVEALVCWVTEEDPDQRESPDMTRFWLLHAPDADDATNGETLCESESEAEVAAAVERFLAARRASK